MEDLIKSLQIFLKYGNPKYPSCCEHDVMYIHINYDIVSEEDKIELDKLGFHEDKENNMFKSYRYGSC